MKPYRFPLETLLELRREARRGAQSQLADALRAEDILRSQLVELEQELVANQQTQRQAASRAAIDVNELLGTQRYQMVVKSQMAGLKEKLTQVREEIDRRKDKVAAAEADVKALEKFDARKRESHARQADRQQQKQLDETAAQSYALRYQSR